MGCNHSACAIRPSASQLAQDFPVDAVTGIGDVAAFEGIEDAAAGLVQMQAVVEAASVGMTRHVGHQAGQLLRLDVMQAEFLETGRVDEGARACGG